MWVRVPKDIEKPLWEGRLEPATEEAVRRLGQEWAARTGGDRCARTRELSDLEKAIREYAQAVEQTPPGSLDLPAWLTKLSGGLRALGRSRCRSSRRRGPRQRGLVREGRRLRR